MDKITMPPSKRKILTGLFLKTGRRLWGEDRDAHKGATTLMTEQDQAALNSILAFINMWDREDRFLSQVGFGDIRPANDAFDMRDLYAEWRARGFDV